LAAAALRFGAVRLVAARLAEAGDFRGRAAGRPVLARVDAGFLAVRLGLAAATRFFAAGRVRAAGLRARAGFRLAMTGSFCALARAGPGPFPGSVLTLTVPGK
jgi:hypothetical protein